MKILMLNLDLPFPVNSGNRIRTGNFIKALAGDYELSILCFNKNQRPEDLDEAKKYFKNIWLVDAMPEPKRNKIIERLAGWQWFLQGIPWELSGTFSQSFATSLSDIMQRNTYDFIFARYIFLGQYLLRMKNRIKAQTIVDLDDIEFTKSLQSMRMDGYRNGYDRFRKLFNNIALERYYKKLDALSKVLVCSTKDKDYLREKFSLHNVYVIPNALETQNYDGVKDFDREALSRKTILFCGNLDYEPNRDGIDWFVKEVFPLIKQREPLAKLHIVGIDTKKAMSEYENKDSVFGFSNAISVPPFYQQSSLVVVPIRIGGGTRIKIIEAFFCRRPVISTTLGAEGLNAIDNEHCFISDKPNEFAKRCVEIFNDYLTANRLVRAGYALAKKHFDAQDNSLRIKNLFENAKS